MKPSAKTKAAPSSAKKKDIRATNPNTLQFKQLGEESEAQAHSRMMASPTVNAAVTMFNFHPMKQGANISDLVDELGKQVLTIRGGCMDRPEAMLAAQAQALDTIFTAMAQRAAANMGAGYLQAMDTYMRLALKAQSQCRTTVEAISEIKNPTGPTFVKQQNIAQNQQVNNGVPADSRTNAHARAHERNITPQNELLEMGHGERLELGTTGAASKAHSELAPVGSVDRAAD